MDGEGPRIYDEFGLHNAKHALEVMRARRSGCGFRSDYETALTLYVIPFDGYVFFTYYYWCAVFDLTSWTISNIHLSVSFSFRTLFFLPTRPIAFLFHPNIIHMFCYSWGVASLLP